MGLRIKGGHEGHDAGPREDFWTSRIGGVPAFVLPRDERWFCKESFIKIQILALSGNIGWILDELADFGRDDLLDHVLHLFDLIPHLDDEDRGLRQAVQGPML